MKIKCLLITCTIERRLTKPQKFKQSNTDPRFHYSIQFYFNHVMYYQFILWKIKYTEYRFTFLFFWNTTVIFGLLLTRCLQNWNMTQKTNETFEYCIIPTRINECWHPWKLTSFFFFCYSVHYEKYELCYTKQLTYNYFTFLRIILKAQLFALLNEFNTENNELTVFRTNTNNLWIL